MAASYTWPGTLPQCVQINGYSETVGYNVIRTPMDAGPAKMRRRSARAEPLSVSFVMNQDQLGYLETFVKDTIKVTSRFYFTHPRKNVTVEVRIVPGNDGELYKVNYLGPSHWTVSMNLEVMP